MCEIRDNLHMVLLGLYGLPMASLWMRLDVEMAGDIAPSIGGGLT